MGRPFFCQRICSLLCPKAIPEKLASYGLCPLAWHYRMSQTSGETSRSDPENAGSAAPDRTAVEQKRAPPVSRRVSVGFDPRQPVAGINATGVGSRAAAIPIPVSHHGATKGDARNFVVKVSRSAE